MLVLRELIAQACTSRPVTRPPSSKVVRIDSYEDLMWRAPKRALDEYFLVRSIVESNSSGAIDQGASSCQPPVEDLLETNRTVFDQEMLKVDLT